MVAREGKGSDMATGVLEGFTYRFEDKSGERTLLLLHGTGGDENDLIPLGEALDPNAKLLGPRGKVLENGVPRFFRRLGEGILDLDDLKNRTSELATFVVEAATLHGFDPSRVVALGFSNGANIAVSTLFLHPGLVMAAMLLRPMYPYEPDPWPQLEGVGVFIASGRNDPLIDPRDPQRLADDLRAAGSDVELVWSDGGHPLERSELQAAATWLSGRP